MSRYDEDQLIQEAQGILGDEKVVAAGYFALRDLIVAQIAGGTAGALGGSILDGTSGGALGAGFGGLAAKKAYAESKGVTIQMIVAITEDHIHVLNRDTEDRLADHVARFDRSTCKVEVTKFGLSRQLTLTDPGSGACLELTGGVSPLAVTAKGDKTVLKLLAA